MPLLGVVFTLAAVVGSNEPAQTVDLSFKEGQSRSWFGGKPFCPYQGAVLRESATPPAGCVNGRLIQIEKYGDSYKLEMMRRGIVAQSYPKAKGYDVLWVDWNSDGEYSADEKAERIAQWKGFSAFKPQSTPWNAGIHSPFRYLLSDGGNITLEPTGCREGIATIGGKRIRIGVVDSDLDGIVRPASGTNGASDILLVDYNLNGVFDGPPGESDYCRYPGESAPLGGKVLMPDGQYYFVRVSPTARKLVLRKAPMPMGVVTMKGLQLRELTMDSYGKSRLSRIVGGVCPFPAGKYQTAEGNATKNGWSCGFSISRAALVVRAGKPLVLAPAVPQKLALTVERSDESYSFGVDLKAAPGTSIYGIKRPDGQNPKPPILSIRNAAGKVVAGMSFEYG